MATSNLLTPNEFRNHLPAARRSDPADLLDALLEIPDPQTRSRALLAHTRRLKAASRIRVQALLLAEGFRPCSLRWAEAMEAAAVPALAVH